jgi:pullulanase/glycogen debranching enzyme
MNSYAEPSDATEAEEFRNAHRVWKEANDRFHDRFQAIVTGGSERGKELEALAQDLTNKLDSFMTCSKAFVAEKREPAMQNHVPE